MRFPDEHHLRYLVLAGLSGQRTVLSGLIALSSPYRKVLSVPGGAAFSLAAFVMRMPLAMVGLAIILLVSARTGSYGLAGAVSATYAVTGVVSQPLLGRMMDRWGQTKVAIQASAVHVVGTIFLIVAVELSAPHWTYFFAAIVMAAGFLPAQSLTRARWSKLLAGTDLLLAAYSWEQVLDEFIFVVGPIMATVFASEINPNAGLIGALIFFIVGLFLLIPQRASEPLPHPNVRQTSSQVWRSPGVLTLFIVFFGLGGIFIAIEVVTVAFADAHHNRSTAAWILALFGLSSMVAGIGYGLRNWRIALRWRLVVSIVALEIGMILTLFVSQNWQLAIVLFVAGFGIAPSLVAVFSLAEKLAPKGSLTEAMALVGAGGPLGGAIAATVAGRIVDARGVDLSFVVLVASGAIALLAAVIGSSWLVSESGQPEPAE